MTPADIAWIISFIFWLIFTILNFVANKHQMTELAYFTLILEIICVGFMWIFAGFTHNWW